jgi:transcriptional regulator with XRE-family HTH domain
MGRDSISTYVHGAVQPTPKNLAKLANALGCSPSDLLPDYTLPVNDDAVMEMTQLPNGKMRLKIIQAVELDTALQIFNILKK